MAAYKWLIQNYILKIGVKVGYEASNPASREDVDEIASYFGDGLKAGAAVVTAKVTPVGQLRAGGFIAVVAASGVNLEQVSSATRPSTPPASPPIRGRSRLASA